jgi:hypothetical protein
MSYPMLYGKTPSIKGDTVLITGATTQTGTLTIPQGKIVITPASNLAIGNADTLSKITNGHSNYAIGLDALENCTTGDYNIAIGSSTLSDLTTGDYNIGIGGSAGNNITTGSNNINIAYQAGGSLTTGTDCINIGVNAGIANQTQSANINIGTEAGRDCVGSNNIFIGDGCAKSATTCASNVVIGPESSTTGAGLTTGGSNIIILGGQVGPTTGSDNLYLWNPGIAGESGRIRIGSTSQVLCFIKGIWGVTTGGVGSTVFVDEDGNLGTVSCDATKKHEFQQLREEEVQRFLHSIPVRSFRYKEGAGNALQFGPNFQDFDDIWNPYDDFLLKDKEGTVRGLATEKLTWLMLHEIQQLRKEINTLKGVSNQYEPDYEVKY